MLWGFKITRSDFSSPFLSSALRHPSVIRMGTHYTEKVSKTWAVVKCHTRLLSSTVKMVFRNRGALSLVASSYRSVKSREMCIAFALDVLWHFGITDTLQRCCPHSCGLGNTFLECLQMEHGAKGEFRLLPNVPSFRDSNLGFIYFNINHFRKAYSRI